MKKTTLRRPFMRYKVKVSKVQSSKFQKMSSSKFQVVEGSKVQEVACLEQSKPRPRLTEFFEKLFFERHTSIPKNLQYYVGEIRMIAYNVARIDLYVRECYGISVYGDDCWDEEKLKILYSNQDESFVIDYFIRICNKYCAASCGENYFVKSYDRWCFASFGKNYFECCLHEDVKFFEALKFIVDTYEKYCNGHKVNQETILKFIAKVEDKAVAIGNGSEQLLD